MADGEKSDKPLKITDYFVVVGDLFGGGVLADQDRQEARDAAHECSHGRLVGDLSPACGCWPTERVEIEMKEAA